MNKSDHLDWPTSKNYTQSFGHKESVTHVICSGIHHVIFSASVDGVIKIWRKCNISEPSTSNNNTIELIKMYQSHSGPLVALHLSKDQNYAVSIGLDGKIKVFDILCLDLVTTHTLSQKPTPNTCSALMRRDLEHYLLVSESLQSKGSFAMINLLDPNCNSNLQLGTESCCCIHYDDSRSTLIAIDINGTIHTYIDLFKVPKEFSKYQQDLSKESLPYSMSLSPDSAYFAMICADRQIRIWKSSTGKLYRKYSEVLDQIKRPSYITDEDFSQRIDHESTISSTPYVKLQCLVWGEDSNTLAFPSMLGVKSIDIRTNKLLKIYGASDSYRPICLAFYQGIPPRRTLSGISSNAGGTSIPAGPITLDMLASSNPALQTVHSIEPVLISTGFKKNRFFIYTSNDQALIRDVSMEKESLERPASSVKRPRTEISPNSSAIIHTSMGDIVIQLYPDLVKKTVTNFCMLASRNYYNDVIIHRIIKSFMIQMGDPTGTGSGGECAWGGEFEDEFVSSLKHDQPYVVSMANAGPNTNGSQFFITTVKCPWLDNKHTIFGKVVSGLDVVQRIEITPTDKNDKPLSQIKILSIELK